MKILVLTDTSDYNMESTLYPLLRSLSANDRVESVFIADRAIPDNRYFYEVLDTDARIVQARVADRSFSFENQGGYDLVTVELADIDAVWLRLDLASDAFLQYVDFMWGDKFVSNRPGGIIRTGTKGFLLSLQPLLGDLMPKVKLCYGLDNVREFRAQCPDMVLKVLRSFGGHGVVRVRMNGESDLRDDRAIEAFFSENGPCLAMEYLDSLAQSDNRLIVSNGAILGTLARVPKEGDWRCNLTVGGTYMVGHADARELEMVRRIDPAMRQLGIHFYGVDTLKNAKGERFLSEINTMNAGCAYRYELSTGKPICQRIADDFYRNALEPAAWPDAPAQPQS